MMTCCSQCSLCLVPPPALASLCVFYNCVPPPASCFVGCFVCSICSTERYPLKYKTLQQGFKHLICGMFGPELSSLVIYPSKLIFIYSDVFSTAILWIFSDHSDFFSIKKHFIERCRPFV